MSKYRKALLIGLAAVLTITGFCIRGLRSPLSNQTDNVAAPPPGTIEVGSAVKSGEQSCWRPGLARNIGIAELSCDFWAQQAGSGGTPEQPR
jgi:hypothetical protein